MKQTDLSARQMRWMNTLSEFDFEIFHIPGKENTVADALSRIYSNEPAGTVRSETKYVSEADKGEDGWGLTYQDWRKYQKLFILAK